MLCYSLHSLPLSKTCSPFLWSSFLVSLSKVVKEVLHRVFAPVNIGAYCFAIRTDSHETKTTRRVNFCFGCAAS